MYIYIQRYNFFCITQITKTTHGTTIWPPRIFSMDSIGLSLMSVFFYGEFVVGKFVKIIEFVEIVGIGVGVRAIGLSSSL